MCSKRNTATTTCANTLIRTRRNWTEATVITGEEQQLYLCQTNKEKTHILERER